jgi:hypothetical protein
MTKRDIHFLIVFYAFILLLVLAIGLVATVAEGGEWTSLIATQMAIVTMQDDNPTGDDVVPHRFEDPLSAPSAPLSTSAEQPTTIRLECKRGDCNSKKIQKPRFRLRRR